MTAVTGFWLRELLVDLCDLSLTGSRPTAPLRRRTLRTLLRTIEPIQQTSVDDIFHTSDC